MSVDLSLLPAPNVVQDLNFEAELQRLKAIVREEMADVEPEIDSILQLESEPLLKVLEYYGITPQEALFVGDSDVDRRAAQAAGVPFIAYKSDLPALAVIERHEQVLEHIFD